MTRTLHITLITRTLGIRCRVLGPCPWCYRADTATHRQLTRHAYPGQPSTRLPPTTADKVMDVVAQLGVELQPWQERAIRALYPAAQPTQPCSCWYLLREGVPAPIHGPYVKCDGFTGQLFDDCWRRWSFEINPECPQHGTTGPR